MKTRIKSPFLLATLIAGLGLMPATSASAQTLTTLYSFTPSLVSYGGRSEEYFTNGANPFVGLAQASDGYFYGTTSSGGLPISFSGDGYGTVFKMSTNGTLTSMHSFTNGTDGAYPKAGLVQGRDGSLYGTTYGAVPGSPPNLRVGTVFQISTNGALTRSFAFGSSSYVSLGSNPTAGLVQGSDGNLYGTTSLFGQDIGGGFFAGSVFEIGTNLNAVNFWCGLGGAGVDGGYYVAGLVQGSDGYLYGTTEGLGAGTVFQISTNGVLTTLYSFTGGNDGAQPEAALVQGRDGYFYGTTSGGGPNALGTVFKITTNGALTTLYAFGTVTNASGVPLDGGNPAAALVQGSEGYFYGTTSDRYNGGYGTVFNISTNGALTTLYSFTGGNDGSVPNTLVQGSDGSFYGTTEYGGQGGGGTVFRLTIVPEFQAATLTNSMLSLTWSTEAGARYQLQYNSDLNSTNWINLDSAMTATGATLNTTESITNAPQRFYRLALSP